MPVVDEYTRECLSLEGRRSIKACGVIDTLRSLFIERGEPDYIRSDNGPEFIAEAVKRWLAASGVETLYIEPSAPPDKWVVNGYPAHYETTHLRASFD